MGMEAKQEAGTIQKRNLQQCPAPRPRVAKGARADFSWAAAGVVASARGRWAVGGGRRRSHSAAVVLDRMDGSVHARAAYYRRLPPYLLSERDGAAPYVLYVHPAPGSGYGGWLVR